MWCVIRNVILAAAIVLVVGIGPAVRADEPAASEEAPPRPDVEERLRRNLRKLDRWHIMDLLRAEQQVDLRQKQRAAASTRPEELATLAEDEDGGVRFYVAVNPFTPVDVLQKLARDALPHVRAAVALSLRYEAAAPAAERRAVEGTALALVQDTQPLVRLALASNGRLPASVLMALTGDSDAFVRQKLATNSRLSRDAVRVLARDSVVAVQVEALGHPNAPADLLAARAGDGRVSVRVAICRNPATPVHVLDSLATDADVAVRLAVARHPGTSLEALEKLAQDTDVDVVVAVARHRHADRAMLLALAADSRALVIREAAQERLEPLLRSEIREDVLERWDGP